MRKNESLPGFRRRDFFWKNAAGKLFAAHHRRTAFSPDTARGEFLRHGLPELFLSADDEGHSCRNLPKFLPCRRRKILPDTEESSFHGAARLLRDFLLRPSEGGAFLTQRAAALHDTAQPPMKSFCRASQTGMELIATQGRDDGNVSRRDISRAPVQFRR